jgi:hypothetical protein
MGGVNEKLVAEVANHSRYSEKIVRWLNMSDPRKWSFQYSKIYMNETVIDSQTFSAYLDLNSTTIRVPRDHLRLIMEYIMRYKECVKVDETPQSLFTCKCRNFYDCQFPCLKLYVRNEQGGGGFNLTLNSSQYIRYDYGKLRCVVMLEPDVSNQDQGAWRLGLTFIQSYLTLFDMEKARMGFV